MESGRQLVRSEGKIGSDAGALTTGWRKAGVAGNLAWHTVRRDFVEVLAAHGAVTGGKALKAP